MKLREGTGSLSCRICDASFQMPIHHLHEPIDVFSEWLDACEAAEKGQQAGSGHGQDAAVGGTGGGLEDDLLDQGASGGVGGSSNSGGGKKGDDEAKKQSYASLGLGDSDDDSE